LDEAARRAYDDYLAYLGQELSIIDTAKEEGQIEGKLAMAQNLLLMGIDVAAVAKAAEMPIDKIYVGGRFGATTNYQNDRVNRSGSRQAITGVKGIRALILRNSFTFVLKRKDGDHGNR
jgi:hypothetical protein